MDTHYISQQLVTLLQTSGGCGKDVTLFLWWVASPAVPRLGWRTHNALHTMLAVCVSSYALPLWSGGNLRSNRWKPLSSLLSELNKSAAGDRTQSVDGQRVSERVKSGAYSYPLWQHSSVERRRRRGRRGGAVRLFKTPYLREGHLSLRPVTMATSPAQCRGEGGERGADTMATQAVKATALMKAEGRALHLLKRQEYLHKLMTCVIL